MDSIEKLATEINKELLQNNELKNMENIIKNYVGEDWKNYKKFCEKGYTRNLAFRNERFEILVICWNKGQSSPIHDHPVNGCLVKILKGTLVEECFQMKDDNPILTDINKITSVDINNSISYQEGKTGLHRIINPSETECSVTIHIYSPPNYVPTYY